MESLLCAKKGPRVVAVLIACMGLFGQATIAVHRRTKEIGVRKVLGATVTQIYTMLSGDLVKLVARWSEGP